MSHVYRIWTCKSLRNLLFVKELRKWENYVKICLEEVKFFVRTELYLFWVAP